MAHFFRALAVDYDGTLNQGGAPPRHDVLDALRGFRDQSRRTVLCTGRIMAELELHFPRVERCFDAIVAENGAVVLAGGGERVVAEPVPVELEQALRARRVPFRRGQVLLATRAEHDVAILEAIRALGLDCQLIRNRGELMVLPAGISKGWGLRRALGELGVSYHSTLAVGDAENDHSLLEACELGVAVANAVPSLQAAADVVLDRSDGDGVLDLLRGPLLRGELRVQPSRWRIAVGTLEAGGPATVPGSRCNVLVTGGPGTGKSYLSGLLAERLVRREYSVCVFDPEGDHVGLDDLPGVLGVGGVEAPPDPEHLDRLLRHRFGSLVLDLSALAPREQREYFAAAMPALERLRRQTGLPHWIFLEEADRLLAGGDLPCDGDLPHGFCLVTYRPGELCDKVRDEVDVVLALPGGEAWVGLPRAGRVTAAAPDARREPFAIESGRALLADAEGCRVFTPGARRSAHVRHWRKYAQGELPPERCFYFRDTGGPTGRRAANLADFFRELRAAPKTVVRHHLDAGDFSRWMADVLADDVLAGRIRGIERWYRSVRDPGTDETRGAILKAVERRYGPAARATRPPAGAGSAAATLEFPGGDHA